MCIIIHAPPPIVNRFDEICRKISKNAAVTAWFCVECDTTSVANALWHCVALVGGGGRRNEDVSARSAMVTSGG